MAKRVLIIVHSYYLRDTRPRRWGTALADAGWQVDVICARDHGEATRETLPSGVRLWRLPARRRRGTKFRYIFEYLAFTLMALVAATAASIRKRYEAAYVVGVPNLLVFAALPPKLRGARVFLDMRDPLPEFFRAKYGVGPSHPLVRALLAEERISARFADRVVTVVPSMASLYERSVPRERITVVRNAPDPRLFAVSSTDARDPNDRTMLYTGSVAAHYGVDLAIRALARLRGEIPGLRLRIVGLGEGDIMPQLRALAEREGVSDRVIFDAPVPLDHIPGVVRSAWIGVQPNRDNVLMEHSLSQKVLEWSRLGLPVVCGLTRPLAEAFTDSEILFHPPGDLDGLCARLLEAHRDPQAVAQRIERARTASERFRYEDEVARLLQLFEG